MQYHYTEVISHSGAYSGALTSLTLVSALSLGIVILTNHDNHMLQETLKWQVIDAFLNKEAPDYTAAVIDWQNKRKTESRQQEENITTAEEFETAPDAIIGTYEGLD